MSNYTLKLKAHSWPVLGSNLLSLKVTVVSPSSSVKSKTDPNLKGRPWVGKFTQAQSGDECVPRSCASVSLS